MFNLEFLHTIRSEELALVEHLLPAPSARILEIGAGTGDQAQQLSALGHDVVAIDIEASTYRNNQVFPVMDYDGVALPFPSASFDVIYSSNVLEHVADLDAMLGETARVLKPGGYAVHLMPTPSWRAWTTLSAVPAAPQRALHELRSSKASLGAKALRAGLWIGSPFAQRRHGERGTILSETWLFRSGWWRSVFEAAGFDVVKDTATDLFYTGHMVLGERWSVTSRRRWSRVLGSACRIYVVRPAAQPSER